LILSPRSLPNNNASERELRDQTWRNVDFGLPALQNNKAVVSTPFENDDYEEDCEIDKDIVEAALTSRVYRAPGFDLEGDLYSSENCIKSRNLHRSPDNFLEVSPIRDHKGEPSSILTTSICQSPVTKRATRRRSLRAADTAMIGAPQGPKLSRSNQGAQSLPILPSSRQTDLEFLRQSDAETLKKLRRVALQDNVKKPEQAEDTVDRLRRMHMYPHKRDARWAKFLEQLDASSSPKSDSKSANEDRAGAKVQSLHQEFQSVFAATYFPLLAAGHEAEREELLMLIWQSYNQLRRCYRFYCRLDMAVTATGGSIGAVDNSSADDMYSMAKREFYAFVKDCRLLDNALTPAALHLIFITVNKMGNAAPPEASTDVDRNKEAMSIGEFITALVKIAEVKGKESSKLTDRFRVIMENHVVPYGRVDKVDNVRWALQNSAEVQAALQLISPYLRKLFNKYSGLDKFLDTRKSTAGKKQQQRDDSQLNLREYIKLITDAELPGASLTMREIRDAFVLSADRSDPEGNTSTVNATDDDPRLNYEAFVESIVRCAIYKYRPIGSSGDGASNEKANVQNGQLTHAVDCSFIASSLQQLCSDMQQSIVSRFEAKGKPQAQALVARPASGIRPLTASLPTDRAFPLVRGNLRSAGSSRAGPQAEGLGHQLSPSQTAVPKKVVVLFGGPTYKGVSLVV